jgi:hypothetical protein
MGYDIVYESIDETSGDAGMSDIKIKTNAEI